MMVRGFILPCCSFSLEMKLMKEAVDGRILTPEKHFPTSVKMVAGFINATHDQLIASKGCEIGPTIYRFLNQEPAWIQHGVNLYFSTTLRLAKAAFFMYNAQRT